jgi:hypothetical protein
MSGAIHEYLSNFYEFPNERIPLLKNLLNFVIQTSRQDIGRGSKYLRQFRGQTASVRIFHRDLPPITGDRRPNITLPDPAFPDGVRTHRAGLNS